MYLNYRNIIIFELLIFHNFFFQDVHIDDNFNQQIVRTSSLSMDSYNNDNCQIDEDHIQKINSIKSIKQPNVKNLNSENINIFNDLSQLHANLSLEQNEDLSGL